MFDIASPTAESAPPPAAVEAPRLELRPRPTRASWAMAWAVGFAALAAIGLIATGSWRLFIALFLAAAPGLVSAFWRPIGSRRTAILFGWALTTAAATLLCGGASGPILCVVLGPALAGAVLGAWKPGAAFALAALLLVGLGTAIGAAVPAPAGGFIAFAAVLAVAIVGASAVQAAQVLRRGSPDATAAKRLLAPAFAPPQAAPSAPADPQAASELARFETVMGDLPELAMLMDATGAAEVVFGRSMPGVSADDLHAGLLSVVAERDRQSVRAALASALSGGHAQADFTLLADPRRRLHLSVRATQAGGLVGLLTEPPLAATTPLSAIVSAAPLIQADPSVDHTAHAETLATVEAERDAAKAESASKSRFLANMSHELRTPLNAIIGFSDIMRIKLFGPLPERYAEYAELIHESGRHLTDLINDILDMSKLEADRYVLQREAFDAREPVNSALKLLRLQADDKGVHLRGDIPSAPLRVDADRRALKQIVLNLVSNALKFTPPEGRVDVTLRALDGALELVVADTGVGIAAEDLQRLGTPYEQTDAGRRAQGTGLGLSLVKALTALHGGEFSLESRLGEGSAATVRLPVLIKAEAVEVAPSA